MTDHTKRFGAGAKVAFWIGVVGAMLGLLWLLTVKVILPYIGTIVSLASGVALGILVIYLLGYTVTDLPEDVGRWIDDG